MVYVVAGVIQQHALIQTSIDRDYHMLLRH